jgi:hypothetical protein
MKLDAQASDPQGSDATFPLINRDAQGSDAHRGLTPGSRKKVRCGPLSLDVGVGGGWGDDGGLAPRAVRCQRCHCAQRSAGRHTAAAEEPP